MAMREKVSILFMLEQPKSWQKNHEIWVDEKGGKTPITLTKLYNLVLQGFDNINQRLIVLENFAKEQIEFNKTVEARLDKIEARLNKIVELNNLKE